MVGYFSRTRILSGNQFTRHFIEFVRVKTKRFVSSNRVLGKYLERICHVFLISKCRGDWDLGRCTFCVPATREPLRNAKFRFCLRAKQVFFWNLALRSGSLAQVPKKWTDLDISHLYILILGTYGKFAWKITLLARSVFASRRHARALAAPFAASRSRLHYYWRIFSFPQEEFD